MLLKIKSPLLVTQKKLTGIQQVHRNNTCIQTCIKHAPVKNVVDMNILQGRQHLLKNQ